MDSSVSSFKEAIKRSGLERPRLSNKEQFRVLLVFLVVGMLQTPATIFFMSKGIGYSYVTAWIIIVDVLMWLHYGRADNTAYIAGPTVDFTLTTFSSLLPALMAYYFLIFSHSELVGAVVAYNQAFISWLDTLSVLSIPSVFDAGLTRDAALIYAFTLMLYASVLSILLSIPFSWLASMQFAELIAILDREARMKFFSFAAGLLVLCTMVYFLLSGYGYDPLLRMTKSEELLKAGYYYAGFPLVYGVLFSVVIGFFRFTFSLIRSKT